MNLTKMSATVRKGIVVFIFLIGIYLFTVFAIPAAMGLYKSLFPDKVELNTAFGQLNQLEFIQQKTLNTDYEIVLNTRNGKLPGNLPSAMKIYRYRPTNFSYGAGGMAQEHAAQLGFTDSDLTTDLKADTYKWRNAQYKGELEIKINSRELVLQTPLEGKAAIYSPGSISEFNSINIAKELFKKIDRFNDPLYLNGTSKVVLGKISSGRAVEANSELEAQFAKVDFFRSINDIAILGPDPKRGLLQAVVTFGDRLRSSNKIPPSLVYPYVEAYYWEIDTNTNAAYPLVSIKSAWKAVTERLAVVTNITPKGSSPFEPYKPVRIDTIYINEIYLAYYDTKKPNKYLQPIYVFDGNYTTKSGDKGNITLYLPAVMSDYISQE